MAQQNAKANCDFYKDLLAFDNFREIADLAGYSPVPNDWYLLVSDVVGSTKAIEQGAYKNVNMVGSAAIAAVLNISGAVQLPFVFGGDGGLVAVPPCLLQAACDETRKLQAASLHLFGLRLRAAAVPVSALALAGAQTLVKKYSLSQGNELAMFAGQGAALADTWLKADAESSGYALKPFANEALPNLDGLSCRWEPLKARNGIMLTLIVLPNTDQESDQIHAITDRLREILGDKISNFAPVHDDTLKFKLPPTGLPLEIAAAGGQSQKTRRKIWTYCTAFMQYCCERWGITIGDYRGQTYRYEMQSNTDFRKYDGSLRMVLDVSAEQANAIERFLADEYKASRFVYGLWRAQHALMTCLIFSLAESQHIHFIDGADGGYAMAAKDLKNRLKKDARVGCEKVVTGFS